MGFMRIVSSAKSHCSITSMIWRGREDRVICKLHWVFLVLAFQEVSKSNISMPNPFRVNIISLGLDKLSRVIVFCFRIRFFWFFCCCCCCYRRLVTNSKLMDVSKEIWTSSIFHVIQPTTPVSSPSKPQASHSSSSIPTTTSQNSVKLQAHSQHQHIQSFSIPPLLILKYLRLRMDIRERIEREWGVLVKGVRMELEEGWVVGSWVWVCWVVVL